MEWQFPTYRIGEKINLDTLASDFKWIEDMKDVQQDPIWHAEGNVFVHTQMVLDELINLPEFIELPPQEKHILVASAIFHDIEKRSTTITEIIDGQPRIVSPKHAKLGEFTTRSILYKELIAPFHIREEICKLVRLHGLPIWAIEKEDPRKEVIYASQVVNTKHLTLLAKADALGRISNDKEDLLFKIDLFQELCKEHECLGKPKNFKSNYGRFLFFNKEEVFPDYEPFNDLKFKVEVLSGLPGSGKDTFIKKNFNLPILSLDEIRREHNIKPTDKKKNGQVIQLAKEKAKEYMRNRSSFVFNATNITVDMRNKWISLFTSYGGDIRINYIEVPYKKLVHQNHNRQFKVPEKVIENMILKLEIPTVREAHDVSYIISN